VVTGRRRERWSVELIIIAVVVVRKRRVMRHIGRVRDISRTVVLRRGECWQSETTGVPVHGRLIAVRIAEARRRFVQGSEISHIRWQIR
jgi:hypothetical protein